LSGSLNGRTQLTGVEAQLLGEDPFFSRVLNCFRVGPFGRLG